MKLKAGQLAQIDEQQKRTGNFSKNGTISIPSGSVETLTKNYPIVPADFIRCMNSFSGHYGGFYNEKSKLCGLVLFVPKFADHQAVFKHYAKDVTLTPYFLIVANVDEVLQANGNIKNLTTAEFITNNEASTLSKAKSLMVDLIEKGIEK